MAIPRAAAWAVLGTLGVLTLVALPDLGAGAWPFRPTTMEPRGVLGPLVRAADGQWDPDLPRTAALLAALVEQRGGALTAVEPQPHRADLVRSACAAAGRSRCAPSSSRSWSSPPFCSKSGSATPQHPGTT